MSTITDNAGNIHKVTGIISDKTDVYIVRTACGKNVRGTGSVLSTTCPTCMIAVSQAKMYRLNGRIT